jgi:hypothetical protein
MGDLTLWLRRQSSIGHVTSIFLDQYAIYGDGKRLDRGLLSAISATAIDVGGGFGGGCAASSVLVVIV